MGGLLPIHMLRNVYCIHSFPTTALFSPFGYKKRVHSMEQIYLDVFRLRLYCHATNYTVNGLCSSPAFSQRGEVVTTNDSFGRGATSSGMLSAWGCVTVVEDRVGFASWRAGCGESWGKASNSFDLVR